MSVFMTQQKDRRQDSQLRSAIDRVRAGLQHSNDIHTIFQKTLIEVCRITDSALGFVVEKKSSANQADVIQLVVQHNTVPLPANEDHWRTGQTDPDYLPRAFACLNSVFANGTGTVLSSADLTYIDNKLFGWPKLKQALAIPILDRQKAVAVLVLANAKNPYHTHQIKRCWPLLTNVVCLRRVVLGRLENESEQSETSKRERDWRRLFEHVQHNSALGVVTIDSQLQICHINPETEKIFGYKNIDIVGKDIGLLFPERFPQQHRIQTFANGPDLSGRGCNRTLVGQRQDESTITITTTVLPFTEQGQQYYLLTFTDDTEVNSIRAEQEAQTQRFKAVSDLAPIGILQTNIQWEALYANDRWCEISGLAQSEVLGMGWINGLYHEDVNHTLESLRGAITEGREFDGECRFQTPLGDIVWVELHARPMFTGRGDISGFIATLTDCTYRHITEIKLRTMAERDSLTGLANRALFQDRLQHALQRADRHGSVALLCLDLDGFKNVNDTLGHDNGDLLLVEIAKRLTSCVRHEDTVARVGGDEFLILMEGLGNANIAAEVSEKILQRMERPCNLANQEVFISTSIGISFAVGRQGTDYKTLLKQADIALYRAKAEGRNNFQFYSPELEGASKDRLYLGNCLHRALDRAEFEVFYQLQANVHSQRIVGTEALLRWKHPERGLLPPKDFIPLLEESGLINAVSRWLWYQAFQDHKRWIDQGLLGENCRVSVNLSPRQLRDPQLVRGLESAIKDAGISGHSVVVEITESALIEECSHTIDILQSLKALGIQIALDDFGTGYSSLTYLKRFAIDTIKIDQTFIRDVLTDPEDAAITQAVLALASSLNLTVVSEGVDKAEILALLNRWGCDHFQGFFLNRPAPASIIEKLLRSRLNSSVVPMDKPTPKPSSENTIKSHK